jgi:outer membrane protein assembly factor BamD (BamD/ComL family)
VLEAVRALRKRGDAARAQVLLDEYLSENPGGALTEDALALAIEAAAARHDPRAKDYARRYLTRFPNGRFKSVALKAAGR